MNGNMLTRIAKHDHNYKVHAKRKTLKGYYHALFGGGGALCKAIGNTLPGCEEAVAMTSWKFRIDNDVYDSTGKRRVLSKSCTVNMTMPEFQNIEEARNKEHRDEILRFQNATESHETGHAAACESLTRIVNHFVSFLPETIPVEKVTRMNAAVNMFIHDFYETMARKADKLYDKFTAHGGKFGAEIADSLKAYGLYDIHHYFKMDEASSEGDYTSASGDSSYTSDKTDDSDTET
jgi:hypothetical protein